MSPKIRADVLRMTPYVPGKPIDEVKRELGLTEVVKLASNENPLGPSPRAVEAVRQAASQLHLYPDASGHALKEAVANQFGLPMGQVVLGNGSDELIHLLGLVYLEPGDNIVTGSPSFVRYDATAGLSGAEHRRIPLDDEWRHDLGRMLEACDARTKLVFIANPHNPTGTVLTHAEVAEFCRQLPASAMLVLDEAYFEFGQDVEDPVRSVDLLTSGANVTVLRTFSKAYGLAGIRVGFGLVPADLADAVDRAREPFNVNSLAQSAAIAALGDREFLHRSVESNKAGILRIEKQMAEWGFPTVPSRANFICIDVKRPGQEVFQELLKLGVIVRSGGPLGMPGHIRVSIGTSEEIEVFLRAFAQVVLGAGV